MKTLTEIALAANRGDLPLAEQAQMREAIAVLATTTQEAEARSVTNAEAVEKTTKAIEDVRATVETAKVAIEKKNAEVEELRAAIAMTPGMDKGVSDRAIRALPVLQIAPPEARQAGMDSMRMTLLGTPMATLRAYVHDAETVEAIGAFRALNDMLATYDACARAIAKNHGAGYESRYEQAGGVRQAPMFPLYEAIAKRFLAGTEEQRKAERTAVATSNAGEGLEWMPTLWGTADLQVIAPELSIESYFETTQMPSNPFKNPIDGYLFKSVLVPESTTPGQNPIPYGTFVTGNKTWTARTHSALLALSMEALLSSILPLLPRINARLAFALIWGRSDAITNGQLSGTIDTNAAIPANDPRLMYDGLRWCAQQTTVKKNAAGDITINLFTDLIGLMGRFGRNPAQRLIETGYMGYAKLLTLKDSAGNPLVLTQDKVGPGAVVRTGIFGQLLGSSIHVDDDFPADMDENGVRAAGGTKTGFIVVHKPYVLPGRWMTTQIMASQDVLFLSNQYAVKANAMDAMQYLETPSPAVPFVARIDGVNISVSDN